MWLDALSPYTIMRVCLQIVKLIFLFSDPITSDIDSAYVIAVDEQARYHLDELSALHKVKAIDICKLQDFGNNNLDHCHVTDESVHFASVNSDSADDGQANPVKCDQSEQRTETRSDRLDSVTSAITDRFAAEEEESDVAEDDNQSLDECKSDCDNESRCVSDGSVSVVMETAAIVNGYPENRYQLAGPVNGGYYDNAGMKYPMVNNPEKAYEPVEMDDLEYKEEPVPHREMAIDCPASFVGVKKEPPRYPPHMGKNYVATPNSAQKANWAVPKGTTGDASFQAPQMTPDEEKVQLDRIKMYQEDLRKRREEEDRITREEEFLRTSLRGSKKLQALEEATRDPQLPPPSGIINPNYVEEEESSLNAEVASKASTLPVRQRSPEAIPHKPISEFSSTSTDNK